MASQPPTDEHTPPFTRGAPAPSASTPPPNSLAPHPSGGQGALVLVETGSTDPALNLAFEDYLVNTPRCGANLLMLWRNEAAVVIGRYQSVFAEVNLAYAQQHGIQVLRRLSGGGAVYHDLGNLCFSLIMDKVTPGLPSASGLLRPIVQALTRLGLGIEVTGRNDLMLAGQKFSGHAMLVKRSRFLLHGTLLFNTDLEALGQVLASPWKQIETKAIQSVRRPVTNLASQLPAISTAKEFKEVVRALLVEGQPHVAYLPTPADRSAVESLAESKYRQWAWTFGTDPYALVQCEGRYLGDTVRIQLALEKGYVQQCQIETEASAQVGWAALALKLNQVRFEKDSVLAALAGSSPGAFMAERLAPFLPSAPRLADGT
jgi:lipoate---protein ligase